MISKILVIQTAFIGDAILASSVLEKLYQFHPDAKIDLLVRNGNEALYKDHPFLNKCLVWQKSKGKYNSLLKLHKEIKRSKYDYVINLHRFASSGYLTAFSKAGVKIGFDKNPFSFFYTIKVEHKIGSGEHEVERNQKLIETITDKKFAKPRLYPSIGDFEKVLEYKSSKYVCMAPTSVWFTKQLPIDRWIELTNKIDESFNIYLLGAKKDEEQCAEITVRSNHKRIIPLFGKLSLLQSAALMRDAEMNYVNDSAPLHLASSMNAPVTAFFCSTVPAFGFTPLSDISIVKETEIRLDCRPCGLHGYKACPKGHFECAKKIKI